MLSGRLREIPHPMFTPFSTQFLDVCQNSARLDTTKGFSTRLCAKVHHSTLVRHHHPHLLDLILLLHLLRPHNLLPLCVLRLYLDLHDCECLRFSVS